VISRAVIVEVGISATSQREMLGIEVGDSEDEASITTAQRARPTRRRGSRSEGKKLPV